ncbi:MAG: hypothetical protein IKQ25_11475 [Lachnospiraceae bacterium]|nr:hypothetical protein [Lachnospiraceae bacterium]
MLRKIICPRCNTELYLDDEQRVHYCDCCGNMLTVHNANVEKEKKKGKAGLIIACAALFLFLMIGLTAGGSSKDENDNEQKNETVAVAEKQTESLSEAVQESGNTLDKMMTESTEETVTSTKNADPKPERDGFDELNSVIEWEGIQIQLPAYLVYQMKEKQLAAVSDLEANNEMPEVLISFWASDPVKGEYQNMAISTITNNVTKELDDQGIKYTKEYFSQATVKGYRMLVEDYSTNLVNETNKVNGEILSFICDGADRVYYAFLLVNEDSKYSYNNDFDKIISSINVNAKTEQQIVKEEKKTNDKEVKKTETKSTDKTEKKKEEKNSASGGVNPDMKAFLDSYEAFVDQYVAFMKKYLGSTSSGDLSSYMAMYQDYMNILAQLEDFERKADQYDSGNMSAEDLAYYLDSLNRIQKKMLEAYY